eukprot:2190847-Pleurochrysis_carterae.AAC.5
MAGTSAQAVSVLKIESPAAACRAAPAAASAAAAAAATCVKVLYFEMGALEKSSFCSRRQEPE